MLATRLNAGFWLLWLLLLIFCYFNSYDDPSSIFYNTSRAYEQKYSLVRSTEAEQYLQHLPAKHRPAQPSERFLCIGIPSVNRTSESFLAYTIATLTDTLTPDERASVHLVVLLANKSPKNHFGYGQSWLEKIADEVILYGEPPSGSSNKNGSSVYRTIPFDLYDGDNDGHAEHRGDGRVENMRLDHSALVETCKNHGSPYFALVEDDIIASRDWFKRFKRGLTYVENQAKKTKKDWLYLRLFYSEIFMGWNNEEWLMYSKNIFLVYTVVLLVFLARFALGKKRFRYKLIGGSGSATTGHASRYLAALVLGLWMPALVVLYFLAGRVSVHRLNPFTWSWHGAVEMPSYGCCAQGLVFPHRHLDGVLSLLRNPPYAFAGDQILEDYARDHSLAKWAIDPSVFQHVGLKQSSAGDERTEVWNFSFERQRPQKTDTAE
ncbi:hypothetical protein PT974_07766 [Cladobotryum mycophilum]|uniref:Integral membrane protein n=1 Tax=Cladobotryum mycophilum TaxID=491253 RepID=A0ABR0SHU7_9HYPO